MMERLVDRVAAFETANRTLDRAVLAFGMFSLALAATGTTLLYI